MEKESSTCRPVPAPRRLYSEIRKSEYENVSIDSINKCLNINSENIHAIAKDKLPNNKLFLAGLSDEDSSAVAASNATFKSILTETNDLYGHDENEEISAVTLLRMSTSTPVPAPRKPQNDDSPATTDEMIYSNDHSGCSPQTPLKSRSSTGAISKENQAAVGATRRAPELPPKTFLSADRSQRCSIVSDISQSSSFNVSSGSAASYDLSDKHFKNSEVPKSASNATLNSSIAGSTASSESSRYKSPSPGLSTNTITTSTTTSNNSNDFEHGLVTVSPIVCSSASVHDSNSNDILKSLGSTSKLLTESIGERFVFKAKGAKHKLDKNFKTSSDLLNNLGSETTNRLKSVGKRINNTIGANFTIGRKEKKGDLKISPPFDPQRPQTVPPNDQVFQTISFSSPLNHKVGGVTDLTDATDHSYEVPKSLIVANSDVDVTTAPPSYEDALKTSPSNGFERNIIASRSLMLPKHMAMEVASVALSKQLSNPNLVGMKEEANSDDFCDVSLREPMESPSPPMPNFPPPVLATEPSSDAVYGKLNPVQPPMRRKRLKNYEQIELRRKHVDRPSPSDGASVRANVDSSELERMNSEAAANEREESLLLREKLAAAEAHTPKPERSDSWEYYEEHDDSESDSGSSPEPVYANQEATYGKVFEMASSSKDLLSPQNRMDRICEENGSEAIAGAVGGSACELPSSDVIQEFDPLLSRRAATICRSEKSNQLLLLEHLLEEDTYGTVNQEQSKSDDDISTCTSEEDNFNLTVGGSVGGLNKSTSQPQTVVLPSPTTIPSTSESATPVGTKLQIVHQNAKLRSDSMENIIDGVQDRANSDDASRNHVYPNPSRIADIDCVSRSNWFLPDSKDKGTSQTRINQFDQHNILGGESPPTYLEAIGAEGTNSIAPNEQKSRAARFMNSMNVFSNVRIRVDALKRKTSFRMAQKAADAKVTLQMIPRPCLSTLLVRYEGQLVRFPSGVVEDILKEMQIRRAILRDRQFQTFLDQEMKNAKETIPLEHITTLQCVSNCRVTDNSTHFYCFEITIATPKNNGNSSASATQKLSNPNMMVTNGSSGNCKHQRVSHLYGVVKESERGVWMQKILESLTNVLPPKYICHYYRAGWCYLKNSITSEWSGTWLVLLKNRRRLAFVSEATMNTEKMDLRKARCIVHKDSDDTIHNLHVESGPMLMIDCPPYTVYMIMNSSRETKIWRHIIREVAHNNGFSLSDQQLTKFNVPVIVDKCVNFIYIHGSMSEGIYRKSGSENSILKLMSAFRADAFNVEITRNEYNEHDVANVLKRFMRDLPERLMGKLSESFICVAELKSVKEKIQLYKELLARLPVIEFETLRKIVGHLSFISSQKDKNKMSVQNLTMIWGPTIIQSHADEMVYSQKEADVLTDLITLYKNLFPLSEEDVKKEQEMLLCLQKYYAAAETLSDAVKKSGDLKMWISLNPNSDKSAEEREQVNVTISPTKTAYEICQELATRMKMSTHEISLHEIILNGDLERPLHHDTKVFDVVLSWSYWPENDRKHNYLAVKPIDVLREVQRAVKNLATVTPGKELKFADNRTKNFKPYQCELRDGKIVIFKKEKNDKTSIVREIFLHSVTAYLGCEKKRDFPWSWAITFVERTKTQILRSRDSPYIGHVLAGSEWVDRTIWFSSIWYSLYGESILPPAEIIIK